MVHVYKAMKLGQLTTAEGCRLIFALTNILKAVEIELMEGRLLALEERVAIGGTQPRGLLGHG
jgi:hypothetical protein